MPPTRQYPAITLATKSTPKLYEMYMHPASVRKSWLILKVFKETSYVDSAYNIEASHHTSWIHVDEDTFNKAMALNKLGGYEFIEELIKEIPHVIP